MSQIALAGEHVKAFRPKHQKTDTCPSHPICTGCHLSQSAWLLDNSQALIWNVFIKKDFLLSRNPSQRKRQWKEVNWTLVSITDRQQVYYLSYDERPLDRKLTRRVCIGDVCGRTAVYVCLFVSWLVAWLSVGVALSAGLHKNYQTDFNKTQMEDESLHGAEPSKSWCRFKEKE